MVVAADEECSHVCEHCKHHYACPCASEKGPFQHYEYVGAWDARIYKNAEASVIEERSNAIPRTTVAISIFFFCTGFQWVAHQLSNAPEECYANPLCSAFGRAWNVKNWNGVFSCVSYEVVGICLFICYCTGCCTCCSCCRCLPCGKCSPCKHAGRCLCDSSEEVDAAEEESPRATVSYGLRINACIAVISHGLLAGLYGACPNRMNLVFVNLGLTMVTNSFFLMEWCKRHYFALSAGSYAMFFAYVLVVITLDNVGTKGDQPFFEGAAWFLAFFGWIFLLPRYFMLLHFGIPNLIPSMDEIEKMRELTGGQLTCLETTDEFVGCACLAPLYRVLSLVDMKMRIRCAGAFFPGLAGLIYAYFYSEPREPLSFVIMMESSWILLFYVVTCHLLYLFCPDTEQGGSGSAAAEEPNGESHDSEREGLVQRAAPQTAEGGNGGGGGAAAAGEPNGESQDSEREGLVQRAAPRAGPRRRVSRYFVVVLVVLTLVTFGFALYMYFTDTFSTRKSRWESADMSKDCAFLGWFDHHDLWNLLSGLFLMLFIFTSGKLDELYVGKPGLKVR